MEENFISEKRDSFFAAANGYSGFRSYFGEIFNPEKFDRLYILKGGPGTGKSSLLKKLAKDAPENFSCELFYCSSDSKSLDGLIISSKKGSVAILDGTAPHATDPQIPGAIEKITNLGDNWDETILKSNRETILRLASQKRASYETAYQYLSICGKIYTCIYKEAEKACIGDYDAEIEKILSDVSKKGKSTTRLITAYGKTGFEHLDTFEKKAKKIYKIVGVYGSEYIFMNALKCAAESKKLEYTLSPSPLSHQYSDAILFESEEIAVITGKRIQDNSAILIDTTQFLDNKALSAQKSKLEFLSHEHEAFLWSASDSFSKASDAHFSLEKIYTAAMDFSKQDKKYSKMKDEIFTVLN